MNTQEQDPNPNVTLPSPEVQEAEEEESEEFPACNDVRAVKKRRALDAYAEYGCKIDAALAAGVNTVTLWRWEQADMLFRADMGRAHKDAVERMEGIAAKRGGEKSDLLLIAWLNANAPERWRNKGSLELTGRDGGPMEVLNLSPDQRRARIAELAEKAGWKREE